MNNNHAPTTNLSLLAALRALRPDRRLGRRQAYVVAERQAARFLELVGQDLPIDLAVLADLPRLRVVADADLPVSGSSHWTGTEWVIAYRDAGESRPRQRFTIFHEFHHILEHPFKRSRQSPAVTEVLADQFSACVLMPKVAVTAAWCSGRQNLRSLASRFQVSEDAMRIRLIKLGLLDDSRHDCARRSTVRSVAYPRSQARSSLTMGGNR